MSTIDKALEKAKKEQQNINITPVVTASDLPSISAEPKVTDTQYKQAPKKQFNDALVTFNWPILKEQNFLSLDDNHSKRAEEYRTIKRPLVRNALNGPKENNSLANLILITSSIPKEGKTYTAINLAISIATERDTNVLLIDADVAHPSIANRLGIDTTDRIGLIDYLDDPNLSIEDLILGTDLPGLKLVLSGKKHPYSTELLASERMLALTKELSGKFRDRIVIFDSPPLLAASQAEVLARLVGQVVFVVAADSTLQSDIMASVEKLENCDVVLSLLNKAVNHKLGSYGYGYGYGYGTYGQ